MTINARPAAILAPHLIYAVDAILSAVTGVVLLSFAGQLTELVGWGIPSGNLWAIGLFLLPWAAVNAWIAFAPRPARAVVRGNICGDAAWVVGSIALIIVQAPALEALGFLLLAGQAIAVFGIVIVKLRGVRALA